jgi:hypothetical protein
MEAQGFVSKFHRLEKPDRDRIASKPQGPFGIIVLDQKRLRLKDLVSLLFVTLRPDNPSYTADTAAGPGF